MTSVLWIVDGYPWNDQPVGGLFYQTQARALVRHGLTVTVACPTPWAPWPLRTRSRWRRYASAPDWMTDEGVRIVRPRYPAVPREPRWAATDRLMARAIWNVHGLLDDAQLIHGHSAMTGLAAWRLARRTGRPLVLTFHGSDLNTWPDRRPDRLADLRTAMREARAVVAVSAELVERVKELSGVEAIHLPIGSEHRVLAATALPRDEARTSLGLDDGRVVVLYVGYLLRSKGVRELADAILARCDRFRAIFVGGGQEKGYGAEREGRRSCLDYVGPRPHAEVAAYMSAADVLVLPSYSEGLPTVLVEAGSLRLPVIASKVGGIPALLADGRGTLLQDVSAGAIGAALDDFIVRRQEAEAAALRLREFVIAKHDVDANAERLLEIYRSV